MIGVLAGQLLAHYLEYQIKGIKYSYIRYVLTIPSILLMALLAAELGGFEKHNKILDFLPIILMIAGVFVTAKILLKKKDIKFMGQHKK